YKLVARENTNKLISVIKLSDDLAKVTTPGVKKVYRFFNWKTNKSEGGYIALDQEIVDEKQLKIFDTLLQQKFKDVHDYEAVELLLHIFINGKQVYDLPTLEEIHRFHEKQLSYIWPETLRRLNPQTYYVGLSYELWKLKQEMIEKHSLK